MPPPLCIASIPRNGSTYLERSILGKPQGEHTPLVAMAGAGMIGSHRPWQQEARFHPSNDRAVFLFGDIVTAVASLRRARREELPADLYDADVLGYEAIWDAWTTAPFRVLCVRYDMLNCESCQRKIEAWLERPVTWLPWRRRRTRHVPLGDRQRIERTYASLIAKVAIHAPLFWSTESPEAPWAA